MKLKNKLMPFNQAFSLHIFHNEVHGLLEFIVPVRTVEVMIYACYLIDTHVTKKL